MPRTDRVIRYLKESLFVLRILLFLYSLVEDNLLVLSHTFSGLDIELFIWIDCLISTAYSRAMYQLFLFMERLGFR